MKLKNLFKDISVQAIRGSKEVEITHICANSKEVGPGSLFIAKRGERVEGASFIPEAVASGAVAILTDLYNPTFKQVTQIIHPDIPAIEGKVAAVFYRHPTEKLFVVGITGTNGKTTCSYLIKHILASSLGPCGLIGTIEYLAGHQCYRATHTTPDCCTNQRLFSEMVAEGFRSAVLEVTSHALEQGRVNGVHFDAAVFTNLTQDHLDYHQTMERYCASKNRLFRQLNCSEEAVAIVNSDSPWVKQMVDGYQGRVISYGIEKKADLSVRSFNLRPTETEIHLLWKGREYACTFPLIGRFNVYNALAALALALSLGYPLPDLTACLATVPPVPGRLEPITNRLGHRIFVDFAHSPDALAHVLSTLREICPGRLFVIFGCGGDRDRLKRPLMAAVAEELADAVIVTSDNPRSETPEAIIDEIAAGFTCDRHQIVSDRRAAIASAIAQMGEEDLLLIAGRGHESHQVFSHRTIAFSDREIAAELCENVQ